MPDKTVAQKGGDNMRAFAERISQTRKSVADIHVPDTVNWKEIAAISKNSTGKNQINIDWKKFGVWTKEIAQGTGKISGVSALWLAEYIVRGLNALFVDNALIRNMESASKNSAFTKFGTKYPWLKNYVLYYMMVGTMAVSGGQLAANGFSKDNDNDDKKENIYNPQDNQKKFGLMIEEYLKTVSALPVA